MGFIQFPPVQPPPQCSAAPPAERIFDKLIKASRLTLHLHLDAIKNSNVQRNQGAPCPHGQKKKYKYTAPLFVHRGQLLTGFYEVLPPRLKSTRLWTVSTCEHKAYRVFDRAQLQDYPLHSMNIKYVGGRISAAGSGSLARLLFFFFFPRSCLKSLFWEGRPTPERKTLVGRLWHRLSERCVWPHQVSW